ncbi:DUF6232 family protein [Methylophilus sp.]|uniref:DUF6232 family protein n=1 Tax=Methylophilus sp. TaxID=29541 RepID=UPI00403613C9
MHETIIYRYQDVSISYSRLIAKSKTYPLSSIGSIENRVIKPRRWVGRFLIFSGLPLLFGHANLPITGLLLMLVGLLQWRFACLRYAVVIHTTSGEFQALISENAQDIDNMVSALNVAKAMRGT